MTSQPRTPRNPDLTLGRGCPPPLPRNPRPLYIGAGGLGLGAVLSERSTKEAAP
jgi:hypothetical protein